MIAHQLVSAPTAPGAMGSAPEPADLQSYLGALESWVRGRRAELDDLDAAALAAGRGQEVAPDMALALALWKAVADRYATMWATWDGGRVLREQRERIAALIWGRLDDGEAAPEAAGQSVPEVCRLCDALVSQLRTSLALTPGADAQAARIKVVRAQLERIRDQVGLEPANSRDAAVNRLAGLMARLGDISDRAGRGADVGGLLGPLEIESSTFERDLIVGNAKRREARGEVVTARTLYATLQARQITLAALADECVATVTPAPNLAVPDVDALGSVPVTPEAIGPFRAKLDRVAQAMDFAQERYADALGEHTDLQALLDAYVSKARALGVADRADLAASEQQAREVLARRPAPLAVCRQLVSTYQTWLSTVEGS